MPNAVDPHGFYTSKEKKSKAHTLYQNFIELVHNMEHNPLWKKEEKVKFGVFYKEIQQDESDEVHPYFMIATNMKRSYDSLMNEFTPYSHKPTTENDSGISTHGYGGIALLLKIQGTLHTYYTDVDNFTMRKSDYEEISIDLDTFIEKVHSKSKDSLPSPSHLGKGKIPAHSEVLCFSEKIWGPTILDHIRHENYKTFYVYYKPDLGKWEDIHMDTYLQKELDQVFQNQFLDLIQKQRIQYASYYCPIDLDESTCEVSFLPQRWFDQFITVLSCEGDTRRDHSTKESLQFMKSLDNSPNKLLWYYPKEQTYGEITFQGDKYVTNTFDQPPLAFCNQFAVETAVLDEHVALYGDKFNLPDYKGFTSYIDSQGYYAEAAFVRVGGIQLTSKPILHNIVDNKNIVGHRCRRSWIDIDPDAFPDWKKDGFYADEMKENTKLNHSGLIFKALGFVIKTYDRVIKSKSKTTFKDILNSQKAQETKAQRASHDGRVFESIEINGLLESMSDQVCILAPSDHRVKQLFRIAGQGIDHVICPIVNGVINDSIQIYIQTKLCHRVDKNKIESYVKTVQELREKYPDKKTYALFINGHDTNEKKNFALMDGMEFHTCLLKRDNETKEEFFRRISSMILKVFTMFSKS